MSSVSSTSSPYDVVVPFPNPKTKTITFIGPDRESVENIRQELYYGKNLTGKMRVYAATVRKGEWKVKFGVNPKILKNV